METVTWFSWEREAPYRMLVALGRETMDLHFPGAAWLRVKGETFDRLASYKARQALLCWETALDALLDRAEHAEREG